MQNLSQKKNFPKIIDDADGKQVVSAKELHEFLSLDTEFSHWIKRMLEYGFVDGVDFTSFLTESIGGRPSRDYALTIDTAKQIAMVQRTETGRAVREYFIECEKKLNLKQIEATILNPDFVIQLATQVKIEQIKNKELSEKIEQVQEENQIKETIIKEQAPVVEYATKILSGKNSWNTTTIAKELGMSANKLNKILCGLKIQYYQDGHYNLFAKYQDKGYSKTRTSSYTNRFGEQITMISMAWTELGRQFIHGLMKESASVKVSAFE
jgi:anti-repressor protein